MTGSPPVDAVVADWATSTGLATRRRGTGPGVLWIHGYTMDARIWEPLWDRLTGWSHLAVDLPWHGRSPGLDRHRDLTWLADRLADLASASSVNHLVGLSFGSVVVLEVARRRPGLASSWTLAAPAVNGGPTDPAVAQRYRELWELYTRSGPGPHMTAAWMRTPPDIFVGVAQRPALRKDLAAVIDDHRWDELRRGGIRRLTEHPQRLDDVTAVTGRLLVVVGEHELASHRAVADRLVDLVPDAQRAVVDGAGHLALLEEPDTSARLLEAHWRASPLPGPGPG